MKEIELQKLRKRREKHFLQQNGNIIAKIYDNDIHFLKNGKYEEIDNTLVKINHGYTNKENDYHVSFYDNQYYLMRMEKDGFYLNIKLENSNGNKILKDCENIYYKNILSGTDLKYQIKDNKVKEEIVLNHKPAHDEISFMIETNLNLLLKNKEICALYDNKGIFTIEAPFMYDSNGTINRNIFYELIKIDKNIYKLSLFLDGKWLNQDEIKYPVVIDPTITNSTDDNNCYDTYIYSGDSNIDRNNQDILKVGVERVNGVDRINRTLIKFELPKIETGSQIVEALMTLVGYPVLNYGYQTDTVTVHRVTTDWDETSANWDSMHDKYDNTYVEGGFVASRSNMDASGNVTATSNICDITKLVKRWYTDLPNYGLMLKANNEVYKNNILPSFFSKNNSVTGQNPKPILSITYRNHNGLERYLNYKSQHFIRGNSYINTYNGNLTTSFNIGATIGGKLPVSIDLFYNTNDVLLENDYGYGYGYKLNFNQTIENVEIEQTPYLKYVDEDGTIHYFYSDNGIFKDEDGLELIITKTDNIYILKDRKNNQKKFQIIEGIGYLTEVIDCDNNKIIIEYSNNKISKIIDGNNQEISITYTDDRISIISPDQIVYLNYVAAKISSIEAITGITQFAYNNVNIIESITDENSKMIKYEYYEQSPYRVKKVIEYGVAGGIGKFFDIIYDNGSTSIVDNKNRTMTAVFNDYGNPVSISYLKSKDSIEGAYGNFENYGNYDQYLNAIATNGVPIKYVGNYLKNTSFESDGNDFRIIGNIDSCIVADDSYTGLKSLKAVKSSVNNFINQTVSVEKGEYYTFSCYFKSDCNMRIALAYRNTENDVVEEKSGLINANSTFKRSDVTIFYPSDALSDLEIRIYFESDGVAYIEDIQLEKGEVANDYNLLNNSDFSNGFSDWTLMAYDSNGPGLPTDDKFEIVTLEDGKKALKIKMDLDFSTTLSKTFDIKGKAGDSYFITFWYKNEGVPTYPFDSVSVTVKYNFIDQTMGTCFTPPKLNFNKSQWQFFSHVFVATKDFDSLTVQFSQGTNANSLYLTNLNLFKDARYNQFEYDEFGNITQFKGLDNEKTVFDYDKNNQLISMTTPKGDNFKIEYDNVETNKILNQISGTGISNQIKYTEDGKPALTRVVNNGKTDEIVNDLYKIRLKGTNKCLKFCENRLLFEESDCNHDLWLLEKVEDSYKICHSILQRYLTISNDNITLLNYNSLFIFLENKDGSYLIKDKNSDKYFYNNNGVLDLREYVEDDFNYNLYLELITNDLFVENSATYTEDGRFVRSTIDSLLNKTIYDTDLITGLVRSITNAKNQTVFYEYNDKRQLSKIINGKNDINYIYNSNNLLEKITESNKEYCFEYDEFLNIKSVKIGDNIKLVDYIYEDGNGDISFLKYDNNNVIQFEYDEFGRTKSTIKMDDIYNYKYSHNGKIAKILSNGHVQKYNYDLSKRLSEYADNDFKVLYFYNENNNVIGKQYILNNVNYTVSNQLDDNNNIIKTEFDDSNVNYTYDYLGRLVNKSVNNVNDINYEYVTNGKRTSFFVKSIKYNNQEYRCVYDKLYNITRIYHNDNLTNRYFYDEYNELIEEYNYITNQIIKYTYDNSGNIVKKQVYDLNTESLIFENVYQYTNNNWLDQLTQFNNEVITYDEIGNPITIGSKILSWINGRELHSYNDVNKNIEYKYNNIGIRTSKNVNGKETKYYLEGNKVIIEDRQDYILYYMYSGNEIIGFVYNNEKYYYIKNIQQDIVGIIDSEGNELVNYVYDSWGNIISMTDNTTNNIGNINPYRYRSYYYDEETNLYYLNTRYYNPVWGRFLNADSVIGTTNYIFGNNLYVYCGNNPVSKQDESGEGFLSALIVTVAVSTVVSVVGRVIGDVINSVMAGELRISSLQEYAGSAIGGVFGGILNAFGGQAVAPAVSEGVSSAATQIINHITGEQEITSVKNFTINVVKEGTIGYFSGKLLTDAPKITDGRNSYGAVFKSGVTKLKNDTVEHMSLKVFMKGTTSELVEGGFSVGLGGTRSYFEDSIENYARKNNISIRWDY